MVDGKTAFLGGFNVGDEYLSRDSDPVWRDTHFVLSGPIVLSAQMTFLQDFISCGGEMPEVDWNAFEQSSGVSRCALVRSGPYGPYSRCCHLHLSAINRAQRRLWLATPFFAPDEAGLAALEHAVLRGVEVRVLMPGASDVGLADLAAWSYIEQLAPLGVRFYRFDEGAMHQKIVLVDEHLVLTGSANLDYRSFHLNHEIILWTEDPEFAREVEDMLLADFEYCHLVSSDEIASRSRWARGKTSLARMVDLVVNC